MARVMAFQCMSSASRFLGQPRWSSPFVRLKVIPLPPCRLRTRVIRCHVEDWSPKEEKIYRKKEAHKKLRKIRKEMRANRRAEELARVPKVKTNPALLRFERPLRNWNKPWRKIKASAAEYQIGEPHQGLGFSQNDMWIRDKNVLELENSDETPQSSNIGTLSWSRSDPFVDDKNSGLTRLRQEDKEASKLDTLDNDRFDRDLSRNNVETLNESAESVREQRMAGKVYAREVPRIVIGRRKGADVFLSIKDDDATVTKQLPRSDLDEDKQLEWLSKQLNTLARPDGVHLSKLIRSGGLKITDGRAVVLVKKLGALGNWRCALQVVEWLDKRNQFPAVRSRYLYTTILAILGKARRPIESLNVFHKMRDDVTTYPDMPAYRIIAVTLGQAGHLEELLELMRIVRPPPARAGKHLLLVKQGRLIPDVVVYNAALNACVSRRHWRMALWILDQIYREKDVMPNSASYGLAIEVMVKAEKFNLAWKLFRKMEQGGFHPNSLTYKVLVEGLGQIGKADLAIQMVKQMEERGIVAVPGVYYALASTLCTCGRWQDALLQVDRISTRSRRPLVQTYTGLIKACKESFHWRDAISVFEHMREVCAPNIATYNIMISVYGASKMYDEAKNLFDRIKQGRLSPPQLYRADLRLSPDVFTYDAMLGACTKSEKWKDLAVIFRQMLLQGYHLDSERHVWILQAISEAGEDDLLAAMFSHLRGSSAASPELYVLMIKSCLRGGDQDKAFGHLEEMVTRNMRISSLDLRRFKEVACLLSEEEDRLIFMNKVESLNNTCDFNFTKDGRLSSLQHFKQAKARHAPLTFRYGRREGMSSKESTHRSLQTISTGLSPRSFQERLFDTALSPVDLVVTKNWPFEEQKDLGNVPSQLDDSQSSLISADIPGWELL
ncbi:unnamed protein product [Calypogeia fissa]